MNRSVHFITFQEIERAILRLKNMNDPNKLHANLFKFAPYECRYLIFLILNSFMIHSYIPENILIGQIKPEIKDKYGNANSSDNYRAVMSSSNFLKIFSIVHFLFLNVLQSP